LEDFNRSVIFEPNFDMAIINRGMILSGLNRTEEAFSDYNLAISLNTTISEAYYHRGNYYLKKELYELALNDYIIAEKLQPNDFEILNNKAQVLIILKKYKESLSCFKKAINAVKRANIPKNKNYVVGELFKGRGIAYQNLKKHQKAIYDFSSSIFLFKNPDSYNLRGVSYTKLKDYENATLDFNDAIKLQNGESADTFYNRGVLNFEMKKFENAIEDFNEAIELYNKYISKMDNLTMNDDQKLTLARVFYFRSKTYRNLKNFFKANEDLDNAKHLNERIIELESLEE
jgi:tetratricopeptide (TPR) repeat protein